MVRFPSCDHRGNVQNSLKTTAAKMSSSAASDSRMDKQVRKTTVVSRTDGRRACSQGTQKRKKSQKYLTTFGGESENSPRPSLETAQKSGRTGRPFFPYEKPEKIGRNIRELDEYFPIQFAENPQ